MKYLLSLLFLMPLIVFSQFVSLDLSFGTGGVVTTAIDTFNDEGTTVAIQQDNKILVGGYTKDSYTTSDFALMRYNSDGSLDASFGTGGIVTTEVDARGEGSTLLIQNDNKIILGGASKFNIHLVRYLLNGEVDTTFGTGGISTTDVEGYYSEKCKALVKLPNGKILLGGYAQHNSNDQSYVLLARYNMDGTLDSLFGNNGIIIGSQGQINSMEIQPDGKIVIGGTTGNSSYLLARFNSDGTPDNTFGANGFVEDVTGDYNKGYSIAIQDDGKILLGGSSGPYFFVARYLMDGKIDSSFAYVGLATGFQGTSGVCTKVLIQSDGKILLSGSSPYDFSLVRFLSDGTRDFSFGSGAYIHSLVDNFSNSNSAILQNDGRILQVGFLNELTQRKIAIVRFDNDIASAIEEGCCENLDSKVFPNPFHIFTTIQFNTECYDAEITLFNIHGQRVKHWSNISGKEFNLSREGLPNGVYFFQLIENNQILSKSRLIVTD